MLWSVKVLHLTSSFPRREGDHHAPFMAELVRAQRQAGIEAVVLAPHGAGLARFEVMGGCPVHRFRYAPSALEVLGYRGGLISTVRTPLGMAVLPGFLAAFTAAAVRLARREQVDLIHAHWWLPGGLVGSVAARCSGLGLVLTCHGSDVALASRGPLRPLARSVLGSALSLAAVSGPLAEQVELLSGRAVQVLRMPLPAPVVPPLPLPPVHKEEGLRLLCVGRLSREKGFDVAIEAVKRLRAGGARVSLDIVGEGPQGDALAAQAGQGIALLGPLAPRQLRLAFDAAHAVVVPSRHEGLGLVALEALARRRPVIAARVGGLVEVVGDGDGLLVAPGDPVALAEAIARLPLPEPTGAALAAHEPARVGQDHLVAYQEALAAGPRRRGRAARRDADRGRAC
jgi:glycosyltransferase involved in cell wall biosynthesis